MDYGRFANPMRVSRATARFVTEKKGDEWALYTETEHGSRELIGSVWLWHAGAWIAQPFMAETLGPFESRGKALAALKGLR